MQEESPSAANAFKAGYAAIVGEPNVGKSTLLNTLLGQKISIVTNKPQTTRHRILGILTRPDVQIIFLDTPGIVKPKYLLHEAMMDASRSAAFDADIVLWMIDAAEAARDISSNQAEMQFLQKVKKPVFLLINKIDRMKKEDLLPIIGAYAQRSVFREIFPVSALHKFGIEELIIGISAVLPEHPPYYPADMLSEQPEKFFVAELIREKIFEKFREEIPYSTTVDIIEFKEQEGRKDVVRAEIYVERDSQKGILIGKQGQMLKEIGELSRIEIEQFLGRPVFLELYVKVREQWRKDDAWLKRLGYR